VLRKGGEIDIYVLVTKGIEALKWRELPMDLLIGLEAGIIQEFNPRWNRRGTRLLLDEMSQNGSLLEPITNELVERLRNERSPEF
jgi:hypothetical protein